MGIVFCVLQKVYSQTLSNFSSIYYKCTLCESAKPKPPFLYTEIKHETADCQNTKWVGRMQGKKFTELLKQIILLSTFLPKETKKQDASHMLCDMVLWLVTLSGKHLMLLCWKLLFVLKKHDIIYVLTGIDLECFSANIYAEDIW